MPPVTAVKRGRPKGSKNKKKRGRKKTKVTKAVSNRSLLKVYSCDKCLTKFNSVQRLGSHLKKNNCVELNVNLILNKVPCIFCKKCPKKFKFVESYKKHMKDEHSEGPNSVTCSLCIVQCPTQEILDEHVAKVHQRKLFECPSCKKTFTRLQHVTRHMRQICAPEQYEQFKCEICESLFTRKDNLMSHLRSHVRKKYKCKMCSFITDNFFRYCRHFQLKHMDKKYICDYCGKIAKSRSTLMKHMEIHGEKKFACTMCGFKTYTIEVMKRHVLRHSDVKPYQCTKCSRSFIQASQLRTHMERHNGMQCDVCGIYFKSKAELYIHKRTHDGLDPLLCPYEECPHSTKPFPYQDTFLEHLKRHETEGYQCEICSKRFTSTLYLKRHMPTHSLDRPRRCMYCVSARAYIRGEMLLRHVRSRHPAIFKEHLTHVRHVLGSKDESDRVSKSEMESILNLLDAVADRIWEQNVGDNVLYGGMQEIKQDEDIEAMEKNMPEEKVLPPDEVLAEKLGRLISQLVDEDTLSAFGWPTATIDELLEKMIEQCGQKPADRKRWSRIQLLRENTKLFFIHVVEDKALMRMLNTHTVDQLIQHILEINESVDIPS